jgi:hypothetical protein
LDRGRLAKIDRKVFAESDHTDGVQAVKVPVSDAVWSTWRRYCEAMGLSMGEGVAGLIVDELETVVGRTSAGAGVFAEQVAGQVEERTSQQDVRQRELESQAEQLQAKEEHLRKWEQRLRASRETSGRVQTGAKVGRNERCPCGSGLKYKHCHELPGRLE